MRRFLALSALLLLGLNLFSFSIKVRGIEDTQALIYLLVFEEEEGFPDDSKRGVFKCIVTPAEAEAGIEIDLKDGSYAVTIFQDTSGDSLFNKWFFGKPKEPFGVSGAEKMPLSSPKFENSCINFKAGETFYIDLWKP